MLAFMAQTQNLNRTVILWHLASINMPDNSGYEHIKQLLHFSALSYVHVLCNALIVYHLNYDIMTCVSV